ncbi:hypothetical protein E4U44_002380 [Claviceps purpurea]|nr:hypothetical protein E4U44_002380 [Claviceps purpurea]
MASPVTRSRPSAAGPRTRWIAATDAMLGKCMDGNPMAVTRETATEGTDDVVLGRGGQVLHLETPSTVNTLFSSNNASHKQANTQTNSMGELEAFFLARTGLPSQPRARNTSPGATGRKLVLRRHSGIVEFAVGVGFVTCHAQGPGSSRTAKSASQQRSPDLLSSPPDEPSCGRGPWRLVWPSVMNNMNKPWRLEPMVVACLQDMEKRATNQRASRASRVKANRLQQDTGGSCQQHRVMTAWTIDKCADCGWPFRASAVRNAMKPSNVTRHSDNNGEIRFRNLEPFASLRGAKRYRRGGF